MTHFIVLGVFQGNDLSPATRSAVAAVEGYGEVSLFIPDISKSVEAPTGISKLYTVEASETEHIASTLGAWIQKEMPDAVPIAGADTWGKNLMPRLAALLDREQVSDVIQIHDLKTFTRPIYAGNAFETVVYKNTPCITVRPTAFPVEKPEVKAQKPEILPLVKAERAVEMISPASPKAGDKPDLLQAEVVVTGGRAFGSQENFQLLEGLATRLGAAIGATRAAVDAGYVPNDYQIGQTGKIVGPRLYIGFGLSGAIQHVAGIKDAKTIVAINKDPEAPIFKVADYGLVGDIFDIIPKMQAYLEKS